MRWLMRFLIARYGMRAASALYSRYRASAARGQARRAGGF